MCKSSVASAISIFNQFLSQFLSWIHFLSENFPGKAITSTMDLGKSREKFQAMENQKKGGCFLYNLMLYSLTALACSLFCPYPCWFSSLSCFMKQFLFIYFPYICSSCCNPNCLFIIANVIIVFLVGKSNFLGSSANSSPAADFYDEYVERCRRIRVTAGSTFPEQKEEKKPHVQMKLIKQQSLNSGVDEVKDVMRIETEKEEEEEEEKEREEEEEGGLPAEELNKRVEEFIARVNKQRLLEAKSLVCCRA